MIRFTLIIVGIVSILNVTLAANENITVEQIYDMASNILNATDKWQEDLKNYSVEGRSSKFFPFGLLPFHALWGFGGLHALAILFAIKFKIIIVASIVAFGVYYYTKFVAAKKCHGDHYREGAIHPIHDTTYGGSTFFSSPITSYSSPNDILSHISYDPYSGYHDSTIHSDIPSYAYDHHHEHDFHDHHHDENHSHDFDHFGHFQDQSPQGVSSPGSDAPPSPSSSASPSDSPAMSPTYRRVGKHRRRRAVKPQVDFIDIGELAFRFLGVDTDGCRKRFVCELDFRAQTNPITRLAFSFIGRNFFERYRVLDENVAKPQKFSECAKVFNDCEDAEKYNEAEDDDSDDDNVEKNEEKVEESTQNEESTEKSDASIGQGENVEQERAGDSQDEQPKESNSINIIRRKRTHIPIRNFIVNRRIAMQKSG
ncbi:uncharacterized protein LOC129577201 [Sitodiplosis mosellana]|uniref:uncharacterized protein LOC129577201 n=1 Tax=Sitodiplosis mosellana TaxID=263140 RepID=UPI0024448941|nr:uncharacterized protein LOC129577201 [Sitodiplosis mosellana]